jgi:hypothetical protein
MRTRNGCTHARMRVGLRSPPQPAYRLHAMPRLGVAAVSQQREHLVPLLGLGQAARGQVLGFQVAIQVAAPQQEQRAAVLSAAEEGLRELVGAGVSAEPAPRCRGPLRCTALHQPTWASRYASSGRPVSAASLSAKKQADAFRWFSKLLRTSDRSRCTCSSPMAAPRVGHRRFSLSCAFAGLGGARVVVRWLHSTAAEPVPFVRGPRIGAPVPLPEGRRRGRAPAISAWASASWP